MAEDIGGRQRGEPCGLRGRGDFGASPERRPELLHAQLWGRLLQVDRGQRSPLAARFFRCTLFFLSSQKYSELHNKGVKTDLTLPFFFRGYDYDPFWGLIFAGGFDGAVCFYEGVI